MQQTLTVSIGRALPDTDGQLPEASWNGYKDAVLRAVQFYADQILFRGSGTGYWTENGVTITEDSFTVVALIDPDRPIYTTGLDDDTYGAALAARLTVIRKIAHQTAVAVTYGRTDLI